MVRFSWASAASAPWPGLAAAVATAAGVLGGCGTHGGGGGGGEAPDAPDKPDAARFDAARPYSAGGGGPDAAHAPVGEGGAACLDGGAGPQGTQLVQSSTVSLLGLTDDDEVVYVDTASSTAMAVPAGGGAPVTIGPAGTSGSVAVAGRAVLDWTGVGADGTRATGLQVWTAAGGAHALATGSLVGAADSSADGSQVAYFDGATATSADLYVATTLGSAKSRLAISVPWSQDCPPLVQFVGGAVVLGYCLGSVASGSPPMGRLLVYPGAAGAGTLLTPSADLTSVQTSANGLLFVGSAGLTSVDASTGIATILDPDGRAGLFTHDGQNVVYVRRGDGSIMRSVAGSSSPMTLVQGGGFQGLQALSPDDRWVLAYKNVDANTGNSDVWVASAAQPGSASTVLASATAAFYGSAFTADSSRLLYADHTSNGAGDYHAAPTTGGPGATVAHGVWVGVATTGSRVVVDEGFVPQVGPQQAGIADIASLDVAATSPALAVQVQQADPGLYLTSAGDRLVYSVTSCGSASQGIWVMATP